MPTGTTAPFLCRENKILQQDMLSMLSSEGVILIGDIISSLYLQSNVNYVKGYQGTGLENCN